MNEKYQQEGFIQEYVNFSADKQNLFHEWITSEANEGSPMAQSELGYMYANGIGFPIDHVQAYTWFHKAFKQGNHVGAYNVGVAHEYGEGAEQRTDCALFCYREAARSGYLPAVLKLALLKFRSIQKQYGPFMTSKILKPRVIMVCPEKLFQLAICTMEGYGVPQSTDRSIELMVEAATRNNHAAQIYLRNYCLQEIQTIDHDDNHLQKATAHELALIWNLLACNAHKKPYDDWRSQVLQSETEKYELQYPRSPDSNNVCRLHNQIMKSIESHCPKKRAA
jgi:TPR repeat protein